MKQRFEPHEPPLRSRLEKWRKEITMMRTMNWPYAKIATWLKNENETPTKASTPPRQTFPQEKSEKPLDYNSDKPIETRRS